VLLGLAFLGVAKRNASPGNGMKSAAHILGTIAMVYVLAGCSSAGEPGVDAGFHYTETSGGTATLTGAVSGAWAVAASASTGAWRLMLPDGGFSVSSVQFALSSLTANPSFGCLVYLPTSSLQTGTLTPADVTALYCSLLVADGGTTQFWGNLDGTAFEPPNAFELNISSVGPVRFNGTFWSNPSATLTMNLAAYPGPGEAVGFSVTVAPPPCPTYCAPGP